MPNSRGKRKTIAKLYDRQDGLCYWCEEAMILVFPANGIVPPKAATVDHLRDRFNPTRWAPLEPGEDSDDRLVCACAYCNGKRATQSAKHVNPAILRMIAEIGGRLQWAAYWRRFYGTDEGLSALRAQRPAPSARLADIWPTAAAPARERKRKTANSVRSDLAKIKYPPLPPVLPEEQGPRA